jgi:hypothetical protein
MTGRCRLGKDFFARIRRAVTGQKIADKGQAAQRQDKISECA